MFCTEFQRNHLIIGCIDTQILHHLSNQNCSEPVSDALVLRRRCVQDRKPVFPFIYQLQWTTGLQYSPAQYDDILCKRTSRRQLSVGKLTSKSHNVTAWGCYSFRMPFVWLQFNIHESVWGLVSLLVLTLPMYYS